MSVIVCRQKKADHPFYIEGLGIHIHSAQELCYAVYHHPLIFTDGFTDQNLVEFIRDELGMGFVAARMEQRLKGGDRSEEILLLFMQECDYYTTAELNRLRQSFGALRKLPPLEYAKKKADYLAECGQYGRAITGYGEILEAAGDRSDEQLIGRIWNNLGACYARIFQFQKAVDAFDKAYGKKKDQKILEKMYYLAKLSPAVQLKEQYRSMISESMSEEWDKIFKEAGERAGQSKRVKEIEELFERDSVKRLEGAAHLVEEWKEEYRNMA